MLIAGLYNKLLYGQTLCKVDDGKRLEIPEWLFDRVEALTDAEGQRHRPQQPRHPPSQL